MSLLTTVIIFNIIKYSQYSIILLKKMYRATISQTP